MTPLRLGSRFTYPRGFTADGRYIFGEYHSSPDAYEDRLIDVARSAEPRLLSDPGGASRQTRSRLRSRRLRHFAVGRTGKAGLAALADDCVDDLAAASEREHVQLRDVS